MNGSPVANFEFAYVNVSIILHMLECIKKEHPCTCYRGAKHPKQQIVVIDMRERPVNFFLMVQHGR